MELELDITEAPFTIQCGLGILMIITVVCMAVKIT